MNQVNLIGRLTRDPDIRYGKEEKNDVARFTLAVDGYKKDDASFINCVAFGKRVPVLEKYAVKGQQIGVTGEIRTGSYTNKDNVKVYTTDVVVESITFCGKKQEPEKDRDEDRDSGRR